MAAGVEGEEPVSASGDRSWETALVHFSRNVDACRGVRFQKERTAWTRPMGRQNAVWPRGREGTEAQGASRREG